MPKLTDHYILKRYMGEWVYFPYSIHWIIPISRNLSNKKLVTHH